MTLQEIENWIKQAKFVIEFDVEDEGGYYNRIYVFEGKYYVIRFYYVCICEMRNDKGQIMKDVYPKPAQVFLIKRIINESYFVEDGIELGVFKRSRK